MAPILVFIHGLESTAQGAKGQFFRKHFPEMNIEDYTGDFAARMTKLSLVLAGKSNLLLVGSSYGGLMAAQFALQNKERVKKIILLAPALNLPEFNPEAQQPLNLPVIIYHGIDDNVVDPFAVKNIAGKVFGRLEHHFVKDDHYLHKTFPNLEWKNLLLTD